jgi:acyl carrier protein
VLNQFRKSTFTGGNTAMSISREDIYEKVKDTLIEALGVDDDEITEDARLMDDLGAESIDFLDIVFRLEKSFDIKIPREELFPDDNILSDRELVNEGKITPAGIAKLKEVMPHVDFTEFENNPEVDQMSGLFRVSSIVGYIESKVA